MNSEIESLLGPMTEKLQSTMNQWIDDQEGQYNERLKNISKALSRAGEELKECGEDDLARLFEQGSSGLGSIADRVQGKDASALLSELRSQSKENPAGVFTASLLAGFVGSRVARKASHHSQVSISESASLGSESATSSEEDTNQFSAGANDRETDDKKTPTFQEIARKSRGPESHPGQTTNQ